MLIRHTFFNLVGLGVPLLVAVATIPLLLAGLGNARFGLLTLIWAVVSYFGLFDLGLGRALTHHLAQVLATGRREGAMSLAWTTLVMMGALGIIAGLLLAGVATWGIERIRDVPDAAEARRAVYAMAFAMPFIVLTSGLRGVLEAASAFGVINAIRLPMGIFTFVGPLAVLWLGGTGLDTISWVLAAGRLAACGVHAYWAARALTEGDRPLRLALNTSELRLLFSSAWWLTLSNTISPLMNYVDRFVIGATISAGAVAYYATPHEMIIKLWILPGALTAVLFPRFSAQIAQGDPDTARTYWLSLLALVGCLLPLVLILTFYAAPLLTWWINDEFALHSSSVLQVLAWGMLATCLATIPYTVIQSAGNARQTAMLHLVELPLYLALLWLLLQQFGLVGAALAWSLRNLVDVLILLRFASTTLHKLGAPASSTF